MFRECKLGPFEHFYSLTFDDNAAHYHFACIEVIIRPSPFPNHSESREWKHYNIA